MILVSALAVAAGSNAFNLTDGSDGLAAGAGAISFGALALVAVLQHHPGAGLMPAIQNGTTASAETMAVIIARRRPERSE